MTNIKMKVPREDITNKKYNRLTAIRFVKRDAKNQYWEFLCDCGKTYTARKGDVLRKNGGIKSCGCLRREKRRKHGMSKTRIYNIWCGMITRTTNPNVKCYKFYGGKGITVCKRWRDFKNFYADMGVAYTEHVDMYGIKNTTIDRIHPAKNYTKKNCRWGSIWVQNRNKKSNIKYKGETAKEASLRLTDNEWLVYSRLKRGWSIEKAFTELRR